MAPRGKAGTHPGLHKALPRPGVHQGSARDEGHCCLRHGRTVPGKQDRAVGAVEPVEREGGARGNLAGVVGWMGGGILLGGRETW